MQLTCMLENRLILLDCHSARDVRRPIKDRISRIALPTGGDGICFPFIPYHLPLRLQNPRPEVNMRVLCLHGMGTSAEIFQAQMSRITPLLEAMGHEFIFVDGLEACDSTEGKLKDFTVVYYLRQLSLRQQLTVPRYQDDLSATLPGLLSHCILPPGRERTSIHSRDHRR